VWLQGEGTGHKEGKKRGTLQQRTDEGGREGGEGVHAGRDSDDQSRWRQTATVEFSDASAVSAATTGPCRAHLVSR
jgi:hypothetical protein